jgi:tetratricopeptide (TPR) repeat protein
MTEHQTYSQSNRHCLAAVLILILLTLAAYGRVYQLDFVNYDDGAYVYETPNVINGLTKQSVIWALTEYWAGNWHPLTMLSLILDVELFGVNPAAHHTINLLFHLTNTLLVFFILRRSTGQIWPSALAAALFAVHPLHVESVAWISERKDVLSTFFGLSAILVYFEYARKPGFWRYTAVAVLMAFSLLSKAMLVTLPGLLLLLDVWPLYRIDLNGPQRFQKAVRLTLEKIPLLALSLIFSVVTVLAQDTMGALQPLTLKPLSVRLMNAALSYGRYLVKTVWPQDLAVFYPYHETIPILRVVLVVAVLIAITLLTFRIRRRPYFLVGWLWYLISLVPVIGIVQVGMQSMADRYTYIPLIGIFALLSFGLADAVQARRLSKKFAAFLAAAVVLILTVLCYRQVGYWQNGETLFRHALEVTRHNHVAHNGLGRYLLGEGRLREAEEHLLKALAIMPRNGKTHRILGEVYFDMKKLPDAEKHLRLAIKLTPDDPEAYFWLGEVLRGQGHFKEAEAEFRRAVEIEPTAQRLNFLGLALAQQNRLKEARLHFREALRLDREYSKARSNLNKAELLLKRTPAPEPSLKTD